MNEYDYYNSEILGIRFKIRKDRTPADVIFEDGVIYTEKEVEKLDKISKTCHSVKKIFRGVIV